MDDNRGGEMTAMLSHKQRAVMAELIAGATVADAAAAAGVHRNTVGRWLSEPVFAAALIVAQDDALNMATLGTSADVATSLDAIRAVLNDDDAPAALRLRAATAMIETRVKLLDTVAYARRIARMENAIDEIKNTPPRTARPAGETRGRRPGR